MGGLPGFLNVCPPKKSIPFGAIITQLLKASIREPVNPREKPDLGEAAFLEAT